MLFIIADWVIIKPGQLKRHCSMKSLLGLYSTCLDMELIWNGNLCLCFHSRSWPNASLLLILNIVPGISLCCMPQYTSSGLPSCFQIVPQIMLRLWVLTCRAEKHNCMLLRQAAIPLTATNFDRIDPKQLTLLTANDMQELLASDQLSSTEVSLSVTFSGLKHAAVYVWYYLFISQKCVEC